jgi:hypothetical protein
MDVADAEVARLAHDRPPVIVMTSSTAPDIKPGGSQVEARSSALRCGATAASLFLLLFTQSVGGRAQDWNAAVQQDLVKGPIVGLLNLPDVVGSDCATKDSAGPPLFAGPSRAGSAVGTMIGS